MGVKEPTEPLPPQHDLVGPRTASIVLHNAAVPFKAHAMITSGFVVFNSVAGGIESMGEELCHRKHIVRLQEKARNGVRGEIRFIERICGASLRSKEAQAGGSSAGDDGGRGGGCHSKQIKEEQIRQMTGNGLMEVDGGPSVFRSDVFEPRTGRQMQIVCSTALDGKKWINHGVFGLNEEGIFHLPAVTTTPDPQNQFETVEGIQTVGLPDEVRLKLVLMTE
ncbi:hypothetical protein BAUCODRAFT_148952 [Baudoinia panamericana UAMH 10762]|uniref:Uncharacterized protein n=1 Tax=Baudoinia panamericana (strain UAMH 10762) TaxID=717646 RepID=M2NB85_BAUPA|nr:uncharacterized protein BAUCODRAFT_148952 [Baudoinia panamericana UAMH 10762]EMC96125.1 hypothetical protein BAUCODRAFT_148952 [Baudoinia panamericana UAMH 10762]